MGNIRFVQKDDHFHVWLNGNLDISNINVVKDTITEFFKSKPKSIILNFSEVHFIDSSAIAAFVTLLKTSISKKTEFVFYDLSLDIQKIFKVASLDRFFNILPMEKFKKDYEKLVL